MILRTTLLSLLVPALFALGLSACHQGPAERAGEKIDRAADRTTDSVERAGDRARDRVDR